MNTTFKHSNLQIHLIAQLPSKRPNISALLISRLLHHPTENCAVPVRHGYHRQLTTDGHMSQTATLCHLPVLSCTCMWKIVGASSSLVISEL